MKQWFNQLAPSERKAIILGTIVVIIATLYFSLWEPFVANHKQLQNIVIAQKNNLTWMQAAAVEVQQLRGSNSKNLLSVVNSSIQDSFKQLDKRIEPKADQTVVVSFTTVSFTKLIQWLGKLYNQSQVRVSAISIERQPDSDQVAVKITLQ